MEDENLEKIFKALASRNRIVILKCLRNPPAQAGLTTHAGSKEMSVGDLAEKTNLPFRSVSKDLSILRNANLVQFRNFNLTRQYSINPRNFPKELLDLLTTN